MKHQVCPNQLYMFDPGSLSHYQSTESLNGQQLGCKFSTRKLRPACWAEVRGMVGSIPTPRDGHSATVSENAMFIFGGYDSVFDNYDNSVYRLDFITWNWTQIEIREEITPSLSYFPTECPNMNIDNGVNFTDENRISTNQTSSSPCSQIPLPRDFACLASYQGRIFLFGGRSKSPDQAAAYDVYDSAVWELIPLVYTSATSSSNSVNILSEKERLIPARCTACDEEMIDCLGTTRSRLFRILWEEETGNWFGPEFWATCPPRPCCLWKFLNSKAKRKSKNRRHNYKLPTQYRSRWSSGSAVWVVRHSGHGLQTPEVLIPELLNKINASSSSSTAATLDDAQLPFLQPSFKLNSPYGRRSPSHCKLMVFSTVFHFLGIYFSYVCLKNLRKIKSSSYCYC
ncbi:unnamed protein product [Trichobilharzia regenti]|nr:unnamed protein product [Trichobilharzia regenti]